MLYFRALLQKILVPHKWQRGCLVLFFILVKSLLSWMINCVALFQFLHALFVGAPNMRVMLVAQILNRFFYQVVAYLTYTSEIAPFPFSELER